MGQVAICTVLGRELATKELITTARSQIGKPYVYGAHRQSTENPEGFDCSSFTQWCFARLGIELPRSSIEQAACQIGREIPWDFQTETWDVEPGDLIFLEGEQGHYKHSLFPDGRKVYIGHVAICSYDARIIHACRNDHMKGVVEHSVIYLPDYYYPVVCIKRIIE